MGAAPLDQGASKDRPAIVNASVQTLESIQSDFDRIALLPRETWDHNSHYHQFLLDQLPPQCQDVLEIGCGTGDFTCLLAQRAEKVVAIDLSPEMVHRARENSGLQPNIEFVLGDALTYPLDTNKFDCIATLTTLHHLPVDQIFDEIKRALKPGGVFVCLDLYQRSTLSDAVLDAAAFLASPLVRLMRTGKLRPDRELRAAYEEHGKTDFYLRLSRIRQLCEKTLPGAMVHRHLFWRYSIVWKKETCLQTQERP